VSESNFTTPTLPSGSPRAAMDLRITEVFPEDGGPATVINFIATGVLLWGAAMYNIF